MLDNEQRAKLVEAASGLSQVSEPPSETLSVDATTGVVSGEDVKVESVKVEELETAGEVVAEESAPEKEEQPPSQKGHSVPYSRFKSVLEGRNKFKAEVEDYQSQISSLEEKLANLQNQSVSPPQPAQEESGNWLDSFLGQEEQAPEWQQSYKGLEERLYKFEVAQEEKILRQELDQISEEFPTVPEQVLLQAVIKDPKTDMRQVAENYHAYVSSIEEQAIARYLEGQKAEQPQESTPRPRSAGSRGGSSVTPAQKPKSLRDASDALRDLLQKDNIFRS